MRISELSEQESLSVAQIAVSFVRDMEGVGLLVIGAGTAEQVRSHAAWAARPALSASGRNDIMKAFAKTGARLMIQHASREDAGCPASS